MDLNSLINEKCMNGLGLKTAKLSHSNNLIKSTNMTNAVNPKSLIHSVMQRFFKRFRLIGKVDKNGDTYWKAQARVNFFEWQNIITRNMDETSDVELSKTGSSISFKEKEKAISLIDRYKIRISYIEPNAIVEYVS